PIKGLPLQTSWMLIWHKDKQFSPVAQAYLSYLRDNKEMIVQGSFGWYQQF
ncbi:MAG: LysR family transcriptional regulator, partial [Cytophagaceae bacterium]